MKITAQQLELMSEWLKNKKNEEKSDTEEHNEFQDVNPDDLYKYERFTYDLVIKFKFCCLINASKVITILN